MSSDSYSRDFQHGTAKSGAILIDPPPDDESQHGGYASGRFRFQSEDGHIEQEEHTPLVANNHASHAKVTGNEYKYGRFHILYLLKKHMKAIKIGVLFVVLILGIVAFASTEEPEVDNIFALDSNSPLLVPLKDDYPKSFVQLEAGTVTLPPDAEETYEDLYLLISLQQHAENDTWNTINSQSLAIEGGDSHVELDEDLENPPSIKSGHGEVSNVVKIIWELPGGSNPFRLNITTNCGTPVPFPLKIIQHSAVFRYKELLGAMVLGGMYILIIFELIDRTVAAIVGSFLAIAMLSLVNARPPLEVIVTWIEYNTLALLFGMMLIVGIFSTTGFFEWIALKAYEVSHGRVWRLVVILCLFTAVASSLLDNVTSMLLLTPVVLRLCKVVGLSPIPVIISVVTISNIGGCATAVGDPPMTIIVNTPEIIAAKIDFAEVFFFMAPGTAIITVAALGYYRWYFRSTFGQVSKPAPASVLQLEKEIDIWKATEKRLNANVPEERNVKEMLDKFMFQLNQKLEDEKAIDPSSLNDEELTTEGQRDNMNMEQLRKEYQIHDRQLFIYCSCVLGVVVTLFFLENFIKEWVHLPLPWIAVLGAMVLMILADIENIEYLLHKVEWGTLMFFAALFVLLEGLEQLGLVDLIGGHIANYIEKVPSENRLLAAIVIIVWVSSIVSAIIDSIPYTTAMIPIIISLAANPKLGLPLRPLVFSLAFGTGLGGNGTIIGSTANLVCVGLAEQYGYPISFVMFAKAGIPIMLISTFISTIYLIMVHVVFKLGLE